MSARQVLIMFLSLSELCVENVCRMLTVWESTENWAGLRTMGRESREQRAAQRIWTRGGNWRSPPPSPARHAQLPSPDAGHQSSVTWDQPQDWGKIYVASDKLKEKSLFLLMFDVSFYWGFWWRYIFEEIVKEINWSKHNILGGRGPRAEGGHRIFPHSLQSWDKQRSGSGDGIIITGDVRAQRMSSDVQLGPKVGPHPQAETKSRR